MDEDTPSEPDEMQEDSGNDQDFMVIPAEEKPDVRQVTHPALTIPIGQPVNQGQKGEHQPMHRMDDVIKPLLPSLHTSSYLARTLEAQHQQGIPHVKPTQATPIPATALASGHQPIYNFASWDHTNAINAGQQNQNLGVHGNGSNPALLGYSSSANSSGSSSGSTYNSSQLGSMGSPSLASPYSFTGSNPQATPGSALGLDLGLPPSPPTAGISPAQQVQHFQGFSFPANNSNNPTSASFNNEGSAGSPTQQQPWRIPPYSPGGQQQQSGSNFESFPSFQGSSYGQQQQQQQAQQQHQRNTSFAGPPAFPIPTASANTTAASNGNATVPSNGTSGSQGYTNQSPSTAAQSFLASGTSGPYSPQLSQREPPSSLLNLSTSAPAAVQSAFMNAAAAAAAANTQNSFENRKNGSTASFRKNAPSFVPSFWAHMSVQHQEPPAAAAPPPAVSMHPSSYRHMHHRSSTTSSFSPTDEYEVLSNHSNTSLPISAPSLLSTSPTLTTSMNLYSMTSPASDISNLPSLSSSFSSAFSGDFLNSANGLHNVGSVAAGAGGNGGVDDGNNAPTSAFKHRSSFMEPLMSLDHVNPALRATHTDLNAAMLKAADAHTDQVSPLLQRVHMILVQIR